MRYAELLGSSAVNQKGEKNLKSLGVSESLSLRVCLMVIISYYTIIQEPHEEKLDEDLS